MISAARARQGKKLRSVNWHGRRCQAQMWRNAGDRLELRHHRLNSGGFYAGLREDEELIARQDEGNLFTAVGFPEFPVDGICLIVPAVMFAKSEQHDRASARAEVQGSDLTMMNEGAVEEVERATGTLAQLGRGVVS